MLHKVVSNNETIEHEYDEYTRSRNVIQNITFNGGATQVKQGVIYDSNGRLKYNIYPEITFEHEYNAYGALTKIKDSDPNNATTYWEAINYDNQGRLTTYYTNNGRYGTTLQYDQVQGTLLTVNSDDDQSGNQFQNLEYTYDVMGNMETRADYLANGGSGTNEIFYHDDLNRVISSEVNGQPAIDYAYDNIGNIEYKSNVSTANYQYGTVGAAGPHAVTFIPDSSNSADGHSYWYDQNGNMTSEKIALGGGGSFNKRQYTYTTFNKAKTLKRFAQGNTQSQELQIDYGASRQKIQQRELKAGVVQKTTKYFAGGYKRITGQGAPRVEIGIATPSGMVGIFSKQGSQEKVNYLLNDHLGSPDKVVDTNGQIIERQSFDVFGAPRDPNSWADYADFINPDTPQYETGYTGHDRADELGLTNMKARFYDYKLGRFIQADSIIPNAADLQSYNRYTYVDNRPLTFTDPSGHSPVGFGRNPWAYNAWDNIKSFSRNRLASSWSAGINWKSDLAYANALGRVAYPMSYYSNSTFVGKMAGISNMLVPAAGKYLDNENSTTTYGTFSGIVQEGWDQVLGLGDLAKYTPSGLIFGDIGYNGTTINDLHAKAKAWLKSDQDPDEYFGRTVVQAASVINATKGGIKLLSKGGFNILNMFGKKKKNWNKAGDNLDEVLSEINASNTPHLPVVLGTYEDIGYLTSDIAITMHNTKYAKIPLTNSSARNFIQQYGHTSGKILVGSELGDYYYFYFGLKKYNPLKGWLPSPGHTQYLRQGALDRVGRGYEKLSHLTEQGAIHIQIDYLKSKNIFFGFVTKYSF